MKNFLSEPFGEGYFVATFGVYNTLTSLDFNYVKPCLDLLKFKLQLLTLGLGVLMTYTVFHNRSQAGLIEPEDLSTVCFIERQSYIIKTPCHKVNS